MTTPGVGMVGCFKVPRELSLIPGSMLTSIDANEGAHAQSALVENGMSPKGGSIEQS